jgi:hypothetical protein
MDMKLSQLDDALKKIDEKNTTKRTFKILLSVLMVLVIGIIANILFPSFMSVVFNMIWVILLTIVIVFISLGVLVIMGLRREAGKIIDVLFEGSLTLVDFVKFIKEVWKRFIVLLKEFLIFAAPFFAYIVNLIIYIALMYLYKGIGKDYDVTGLTIGLTVVLVAVVALINKPKKSNDAGGSSPWFLVFKERFRVGFSDGMEILIFLFFLTMDRENLFFLPESFRVPLRAQINDYDLMIKGFVYSDHLKTTINLIIIAVFTEIVRNIIRLIAAAIIYYRKETSDDTEEIKWSDKLKIAIRQSFAEIKDDFVIFVTYTTFLLFVFLLFPRLKLLTLAIASVTALVLDVFMPSRVKPEPKTDLIARVLIKVFRLNNKPRN